MVLSIRQFSAMEKVREDRMSPRVAPEPFKLQVGGTTSFFSLPNGHLLKPCDERELLFYRFMPSELLPIAPRCCSTIEGRSCSSMPQCCSTCTKEDTHNFDVRDLVRPSSLVKRRTISRNFVVLSDLTRDFERPCVLDLKLGIRQHRDSAPPEKIASQSRKCSDTTSAKLGLRLCGMQYWTPAGEKIYVDKLEGRQLDEDGLARCLSDFFSSTEATQKVLTDVRKVKEVLSLLDGVRLFGSSLLIVVEAGGAKAEVRLVDFANATLPGLLGSPDYSGPDEGALKGLSTLEELIESLPST